MTRNSDDLQAALDDGLQCHRVAGASVAVFHEGELTTAAAGIANMTTGVEVTAHTLMHIGSITKVFNATLVMQLVDEGRVDLEERLLEYLPDLQLKDREALEQITVKMLLNHTSGIDGETLPDHGHDEETIEKGIARYAQLGQLFPPGSEFSYCNAATVIAGYLAQRLTGRSWYHLVRERIFEPLQMEHAATLPEEALLHQASVGHFLDSQSRRLVRTSTVFLPLSWAPCGTTLMMSASDLITFARAHIALGAGPNGARILSASSAQAMQQITMDNRGSPYADAAGFGIGWMVFKNGLLHHAGGGPGIASVLYAHPQRRWAVAVLTNAEHGFSLVNELVEPWLKEFGAAPAAVTDSLSPAQPARVDFSGYVGVYADICVRYRVLQAAEGLALSRQWKFAFYDSISTEETPPERLKPLGEERFLLESDGKRDVFTFKNPDAAGRMQHLVHNARFYLRAPP